MNRTRTRHLLLALAAAGLAVMAALVVGCGGSGGGTSPRPATTTTPASATVTVALDWVPNTNHTGIYVAKALGFYRQAGINVHILPYGTTAPETLVAAGKADFGISYEAGTIFARAAGEDVIAVFAILQHDALQVGVRATNGAINSPKDLDGKTYAGFGTPDEGPTLKYVIRRDGGTGSFTTVDLNTSAYDAVWTGRADFTLSYTTWEAIQGRLAGRPFKPGFGLTQLGLPDNYSTLMISSNHYLSEHPDIARRFLAATQQGYQYAAAHPAQAAHILIAADPNGLGSQTTLVNDSALLLARSYYLDASGVAGPQTTDRWAGYGNLLFDAGALTDANGAKVTRRPDWSTYYTNAYLPAGAK
jgi:ABC-type nitrate/sulfonate/bicarbonate transport system substrate-binding protein